MNLGFCDFYFTKFYQQQKAKTDWKNNWDLGGAYEVVLFQSSLTAFPISLHHVYILTFFKGILIIIYMRRDCNMYKEKAWCLLHEHKGIIPQKALYISVQVLYWFFLNEFFAVKFFFPSLSISPCQLSFRELVTHITPYHSFNIICLTAIKI